MRVPSFELKWLLSAGFLISTPVWAAVDVKPVEFPSDRYEKMFQNSPFALATAPAAPPQEAAASFAVNLTSRAWDAR